MDAYAPINGITLERYAELGAELDGIQDPSQQRTKVETLGVNGADWDAAKAGWTARMQDPANMGQVASRYMQLYNAALSQTKGTTSLGFEDWCYVSASIQVFGSEGALAHHGLSMSDWTTASAEWQTKLSQDPMNLAMQKNNLQMQEAQRLQQGGQPRQISVNRSGPGQAPAGGAMAYDAQASMQAQMQAVGASPAAMAQAQQAMAAMGIGGPGPGAGSSGPAPGSQVQVKWSDGNAYAGTVTQVTQGQAEVRFPNGQSVWAPLHTLISG